MLINFVRSRRRVFPGAVLGFLCLSLGSNAVQGAATITSFGTQGVFGPGTAANDVDGQGLNGQFAVGNEYDVNYSGDYTKLTSVTTSLGTFKPTATANYLFRRSSTPNNDIVYYRSTGSTGSSINLNGSPLGEQGDAFAGNTLSLGVDNMFANVADRNGNVTNVERVDMVFTGGVTVTGTKGFAVIERGNLNDHDAFGIVAITAIDQSGNPTAYGDLKKFGLGTWGNTGLLSQTREYVVMRKDNDDPNGEFGPSALVQNNLGGVFVPLTDLAGLGQTIFGFSIVGGDVNTSGANLVNWSNGAFYPKNTSGNNGSPGGLDPTGTLALLYDSAVTAVPEPTSAALLGVAALAGLARRRPRSL